MSYQVTEHKNTVKLDEKGETVTLANFTATITKETRYDDGKHQNTELTIVGENSEGKFDEITVPAEKFGGMGWVMPAWGVAAVIQPGSLIKEDLRTAIQLASKPSKETVFTHIGWTKIKKEDVYLHAKGGISKDGNSDKYSVMLPSELGNFRLETSIPAKDAIKMTLKLLEIAVPEIAWPLLAGVITPLLGATDFAIHIAGRTGTFKSELASLCQSHYGSGMDARSLPGSWSSTANALEAQAFRAKNAIFCVDDFIPTGSSWQVRAYQKTADQILRGQGNQAGRARLTDVSSLQTTMFPRGMILSTGEDIPEGHSIRARMLILEIAPGDLSTATLTLLQANRHYFPNTIGHYAAWLARDLAEYQKRVRLDSAKQRDLYVALGHSRTPSTIGRLLASLSLFLQFAQEQGAIGIKKRALLAKQAKLAILSVAAKQETYLIASDPCEAFCETIRTMIGAHIAHFRTRDGGIPASPTTLGWSEEQSSGDIPTFKSHGKTLGWVSWDTDELLIDASSGYADIKRHAGGLITFTKQTMLKRLKDAGLLLRVDETRQRNTIRVTCGNQTHQVLAMPLSQVLETAEKPNQESN